MGFKRMFTAMLLLAAMLPAAAQPIPVEDFWKRSSFRDVKISPDGRYLAATVPFEKLTALVVMDLASKQITGSFKPQEKAYIGEFYWVSNKRLLFTSSVREGANARPSWTGAWYAMNADGSGVGTAYGRGYYAQILDTLKDDDKYVLVQYASDTGSSTYGRMNVENGDILPTFKKPPKEGYGEFVTDNAAKVRLFINAKSYKESKVYARASEDAEWVVIHDQKATEQDFEFKAFSADNSVLYYTLSQKSGPSAVFTYSFKTGEKKQIARDDNVDPGVVMSSPVDDSVYAIRFEDGFPRYEFIDKANPFARNLIKLQASFPDTDVYPVSATRDGNKIIYVVESDTVPGEYYLFDNTTQKAEHLVSRASWIDSGKLSLMDPMKFKARDGLDIEVFVTLPKGSTGKNLPLIVNPHGGPFGPYDSWGYNPEVQMLASRGYAVMQVNFRGSGNYGKEFREKGYRQWGKAMQDDLTDATRWAISQGIADPDRICIYGASYGGYAALMGAAKEPMLYRCAVGNVGTYDLPTQLNYSTNGGGGMNPAKAFFGDVAQDDVAQFSPARLAGNIKIPVLLFAGEKDTTCPPEQSKMMHAALQKVGTPVELKIYPGEGHGNVLKENQIDFANRLLAFFEKNLKEGTVTASPLKPVK
ncbi:S9 family peptidase [Arenimonas sp. GDDSR-1]|uniref:S9 family peptidase n=1 Tax=Arenimonas sp. GDDSR-1 TaxID=2950125 RepID=UPI002630300E|nr:S9 family peptidase [Arenimonas sp. GDDSR-1]